VSTSSVYLHIYHESSSKPCGKVKEESYLQTVPEKFKMDFYMLAYYLSILRQKVLFLQVYTLGVVSDILLVLYADIKAFFILVL